MAGSISSNTLVLMEPVLAVVALAAIIVRNQFKDHRYLCLLLGFRVFFASLLLPLMLFAGHGIEPHHAYATYFKLYWTAFAVEAGLGILLIHGTFKLAMAPLNGIRKLGALVFRWAASISLAVAIAAILLPHGSERHFVVAFVTELQRTQSILTLCLLLFVCFTVRPLGLAYSSRIFGVCLGLGILAGTNLATSACLAYFHTVYSTINFVNSLATCTALLVWTAYFVLPEPKRRIIVLPTTSPFLRWNQIAQVLGDAPGFVAVGGIPPELFAPAELELMRRASIKMTPKHGMAQANTRTA